MRLKIDVVSVCYWFQDPSQTHTLRKWQDSHSAANWHWITSSFVLGLLDLCCSSCLRVHFLQKASGETANVPGFVFGITNLEGEIYFEGAGNNVVNDPTSGPLTPDSVFWICSQTKLIVAVCHPRQ